MKFKAGEIAPAASKTLEEMNGSSDLTKEGEDIFKLACSAPIQSINTPSQQIQLREKSPKDHSISESFLRKRLVPEKFEREHSQYFHQLGI